MQSELTAHFKKLASKGGKKRWSGTTKAQRSKEMAKVAKRRWAKENDGKYPIA